MRKDSGRNAERADAAPRRAVPGKFIGFFRLLAACETGRCPICACLTDDSRRALDAMLGEHVTDPRTRDELYAAWGFCSWHASSLGDGSGVTGTAILFEDLLRLCGERFGGFAPASPPRGSPWAWLIARLATPRARERIPAVVSEYRARRRCRICVRLAQSERSYIDAVVAFADDQELRVAYDRSAGLCVPHLAAVVARGERSGAVPAIVNTTLRRWNELRGHLAAFVRKHEYRATGTITEAEAGSYRRAAETLAGLPQLFGNDLPRPLESAIAWPAPGTSVRTTAR
jgi:hypothetical protein